MPVPFDSHWDRLPHLFAGELSEDEADALRQWIDAVSERRAAVERMREVWHLTGVAPRAWDVEAGRAAIQQRIAGERGRVIAQVGQRPQLTVLPPRRRGWWMTPAAAAVLFVTACVTFVHARLPSS